MAAAELAKNHSRNTLTRGKAVAFHGLSVRKEHLQHHGAQTFPAGNLSMTPVTWTLLSVWLWPHWPTHRGTGCGGPLGARPREGRRTSKEVMRDCNSWPSPEGCRRRQGCSFGSLVGVSECPWRAAQRIWAVDAPKPFSNPSTCLKGREAVNIFLLLPVYMGTTNFTLCPFSCPGAIHLPGAEGFRMALETRVQSWMIR